MDGSKYCARESFTRGVAITSSSVVFTAKAAAWLNAQYKRRWTLAENTHDNLQGAQSEYNEVFFHFL